MTGSLYYEVTASGQRVALCVDKADAEIVAEHWYDGQVREAHVLVIQTQSDWGPLKPIEPGEVVTYSFYHPTPAIPTGEAKRKEDTQP